VIRVGVALSQIADPRSTNDRTRRTSNSTTGRPPSVSRAASTAAGYFAHRSAAAGVRHTTQPTLYQWQ
jgi:hypothetical protein